MNQARLLETSPYSILALCCLLLTILFVQPGLDNEDELLLPEQDSASQVQDELLESNESVSESDVLPLFLFTRLATVIQLQAQQRASLGLILYLPDIVHLSLSERGPPLKHSL